MSELEQTVVTAARDRVHTVYEGGAGRPLVWLHGPLGLEPDLPLLERLADQAHVYAPVLLGFTHLDELTDIPDVHDLALFYDDLLDVLDLPSAALAGHSFGAMLAAEIAAHCPRRVDTLALVSPLGLWDDDLPVADLVAVTRANLSGFLHHDKTLAKRNEPDLSDPETVVSLTNGLATVAKFTYPIPDRGLTRRAHRITQPTVVIHGEEDAWIPAPYAGQWCDLLASCEAVTVPGAGHMLTCEQPDAVIAALGTFLAEQSTSSSALEPS